MSPGEETTNPRAAPPKPMPNMTLPTPRLVTVSFVVGAFAGLALWAMFQVIRPGAESGIAIGVCSGVFGSIAGALVIKPWMPRPLPAWPMLMLGAQGIGLFVTLFASGLLYWSSRPDPLGLAAGSVLSFVGAVIGHVRVFAACARSVGPVAVPSQAPESRV